MPNCNAGYHLVVVAAAFVCLYNISSFIALVRTREKVVKLVSWAKILFLI